MKKLFRILPFAVVLVALFLFQNILGMFLNKQKLLSMESNHLLTTHHVELNDYDLNDDVINKMLNSYWKIKVLVESKDAIILGYYCNDYSNSTLPLFSGKMFQEKNSKQAIVGKQITTTVSDEKEWINYQGNNYEVIGKLGLADNSPIDNYILINDIDLFQKSNEEVIYLDSLNEKKLDALKEKYDLPRNNVGVERWFNISTYTTLVQLIGIILLFSISVIIAIIFFNIRKDMNELKHQLGVSLTKSVLKEVTLLFCIDVVFLLTTVLHYIQYTSHLVLSQIIIYNLFSIIIITFTYVINVNQQLRRLNK